MFFMVIDSRSDVYGNAVGRASLPYCPTPQKGKTDLNRAVPLCILLLFCAFLQEKRGYPTPENAILHPILHPKSLVNTGILGYGCRKCRIFFQNFFRGRERRGSSPMFLISEKGKVLNTDLSDFADFTMRNDIYAIGHARPEVCLYQFKSVKSGFIFAGFIFLPRPCLGIRIYLI